VIVDVDCTKDTNEQLCQKYGVEGYPTLKYITGSTDPLGDSYEGGRDFDDLKAFADENLGPSCGYHNMDLCSDEQKAAIDEVAAMDNDERGAEIAELEKKAADAEALFSSEVEKLQARYEQLQKDKEEAIDATKPGLKKLRSVHIAINKESGAGAKDEL